MCVLHPFLLFVKLCCFFFIQEVKTNKNTHAKSSNDLALVFSRYIYSLPWDARDAEREYLEVLTLRTAVS